MAGKGFKPKRSKHFLDFETIVLKYNMHHLYGWLLVIFW